MNYNVKIEKNVLTVPEAAYFLNCSSQKIYKLIHMNEIEAYKDTSAKGGTGRDWKISALSLVNYQSMRMFKQSQEESSDAPV